ncbi:MAG: RHS repeat domain-containing protein [Pyrinomonadaceae bacterium]
MTYDKWLGTTAQTLTAVEEPAIDNTTNRISSSGYSFDANGNLIVDADGRQFTFNGDNKQTRVKDAQNNVIGTYSFDGEGKRIKKVVGNDTTVFVYSGSKLIAEYSTETPPSNPTTSWTVSDQLGSPRVIVNSLGAIVSRRDFMPFGEELDADGTCRTTGQKYGQTDSVRQKFTGYQKDDETGLDFAEARMYQNLHGRFTAIDPLLASGKSANPQTFNRYVYVMNRPLILTDSTGLQAGKPADPKKTPAPTRPPKVFNTPDVKITDLDRNESTIQLRNFGIKGKALNGDPVVGGDGKPLLKEDGRTAVKEYGIVAEVSYQLIFAREGDRPDEGSKVILEENVVETLDGKEGPGYSKRLQLIDNEDGNSFYGGDIIGLTNADPDGQGPSTKVYKGQQTISLIYTVDGKERKEVVRANEIEINMTKNSITVTEVEKKKRNE